MGPEKEAPPLPEFEFLFVPEEQRSIRLYRQHCNYLQALEGGIDPTHPIWLHSPYDLNDDELGKKFQPTQQRIASSTGARTPEVIEIVDTPGGFMYGAKRPMKDGRSLWRINQFILPFYTMPPGGDMRGARMWVPMDDEHCIKWPIHWYPTREVMENTKESGRQRFEGENYVDPLPEPYGFIVPKANKSNDYLCDWTLHTTRRMGVAGVNLQDITVTENEGPTPTLDRRQENLCSGDRSIVKARRMLLRLAKEFREQGKIPPGVRDASVYRVRGAAKAIPNDIPWTDGARRDITVASPGVL
jgi:hypothetical protein